MNQKMQVGGWQDKLKKNFNVLHDVSTQNSTGGMTVHEMRI